MSKVIDEKGNEIIVTKEDFQLCQDNIPLHDSKFETKPTTFAKDAFKRFCKNKSSVVGACIIGLLVLLALIVPVVSPFDITQPDNGIVRLPPKVFEAGHGWWDGTKTYTGKIYDIHEEKPLGDEFVKSAVVEITNQYNTTTNVPNVTAFGGSFLFVGDETLEKLGTRTEKLYHDAPITVNTTDNNKVSIKLSSDVDGVVTDATPTEYRVSLFRVRGTNQELVLVLKDWSEDYSSFEINISEALAEAGISEIEKARVVIEIMPISETHPIGTGQGFILIDQVVITTENQELAPLFEEVSITDVNASLLVKVEDKSNSYWKCTGFKRMLNAFITLVDFVYDPYEAALGEKTMTMGKSEIDRFINNGWCKYDYNIGPSSFEIIDEKCPIITINSILTDQRDENGQITLYETRAQVMQYKYKGFDKMPNFIFGSTDNGYDIITLSFNGLRLSLLIALFASAVCFLFGLCWGSVSGYFGGNVDLFMERFCDILGGIPWIVLMTLAILLFSDGVVTFALALCLTGWMGTAARTRTQFYRFKGREYILASRTLGASDGRLIFKHILPNAMGTIITSSVLMIPSVIFSEATLSYLGIGLQGSNSFGNVLSANQQHLKSLPALILFPAAIISLIMISFNLFGNGLRDAFNPSLKGSE